MTSTDTPTPARHITADQIAHINDAAASCHHNAAVHGFHDFNEDRLQFVTRACMLQVTEIVENFEAHRNRIADQPCDKSAKMLEPLTNEEEELADLVIRAFDYAGRRGINIGRAIFIKHAYNITRPHLHGNKAC